MMECPRQQNLSIDDNWHAGFPSLWQGIGQVISAEEFSKCFEKFQSSAFRLETLPEYAVSHEDRHYCAYASGELKPPFVFEDWKHTIRSATESGKSFDIMRIVPDKMTTYFRYELEWHYLEYADAGQNTRFILPDNLTPELSSLEGKDYWLFDDTYAVAIRYNAQGNVIDFTRIDDAAVIEGLKDIRDKSRERSISLQEFLKIYRNGELG